MVRSIVLDLTKRTKAGKAKRSSRHRASRYVAGEGSFSRYCKKKGHKGANSACVRTGKKSTNPKIRKAAKSTGNLLKRRRARK